MSLNKFIVKIYSITNLMTLILYHECLYEWIFKVIIVYILTKRANIVRCRKTQQRAKGIDQPFS